ncbi:caspase recruitment domain-containing protein 19 isoform X1 [Ornithorhynchus anatinus]|uniref:Caspase recruitment domain-containing protein 19 n=2 Tax=Ornithorhynchus anatinus TaxID=9258 RepID=A0A6I8NTL3_ORNAN|nr:caspase recruitment domain-containing protein 19 isoform X1 [Ornithorhynchus anatinus]
MLYRKYQTFCDQLMQDTPFLISNGRLSEQEVDKIILQLNRYYPQILTNKEAEKFRNPKTLLHVRLNHLLNHLQKKGERDCQEFYRALYINAQHQYNSLPSRKNMKTSDSTEIDTDKEKYNLNDRGPMFFLACFSMAAGLAFLMYYHQPDPKVFKGARRVMGFSPIIIGKHVSPYFLAFLEDNLEQ